MQFVVISVSGGEEKRKKKKLPLGVSPILLFNSSFLNHLSWEAPQSSI